MSIHFNETEIEDEIENIFVEGRKIEAVFNIESSAPVVYPTEIFKCNYESSVMLLYQTRPKILPSFKYESMDIAVLLTLELNRKLRVGLRCEIAKFINNYQVSERIKEDFFLIEYSPPMRKINLRSTFRLRTSYRYVVGGNFDIKGALYFSEIDFKIQDISVTGVGMLVPKKIGKKHNPLLDLEVGQEFKFQLRLKDVESPDSEFKITTIVKIARKMISFNDRSGFIGARFIKLEPLEQEKLFRFIHDAQIYEIRSIKQT